MGRTIYWGRHSNKEHSWRLGSILIEWSFGRIDGGKEGRDFQLSIEKIHELEG